MAGHRVPDSHTADVHARRLIEKYTPLIYKVVRSMGFGSPTFQPEGLTMDDALQAGRVALWQAHQTFDPALAAEDGDPFVAYAYSRIRHEVLNELRRCRWFSGLRDVRMRIESLDSMSPLTNDPTETVSDRDWLDKIDASVERMDARRRNIFQGVMLHDGHGKNGTGNVFCKNYGISDGRLSQLRLDIRQKLREALH